MKMSNTYTSRPTRPTAISASRRATRSRGRGVGAPANTRIETSTSLPSQRQHSESINYQGGRRLVDLPPDGDNNRSFKGGNNRGGFKADKSTSTQTRGRRAMEGSTFGRGRGQSFDSNFGRSQTQSHGASYNGGDESLAGRRNEQTSLERRGQHTGAYTVFSPDEKRRQEVNQMAQKGIQAYESYKKANAGKTYSYVGISGGGEASEDQVRARQAQAMRQQKFNRLMKQEGYREARRKEEETAIQAKKDDARRKAEQNAARQRERQAPAEEVRRNREAFLSRFEASNRRQQTNQDQMSSSDSGADRRARDFSPASTARQGARDFSSASTARQGAGNGEEFDLKTLCDLYPYICRDELKQLLRQQGSVEAAVELLNFDDAE